MLDGLKAETRVEVRTHLLVSHKYFGSFSQVPFAEACFPQHFLSLLGWDAECQCESG